MDCLVCVDYPVLCVLSAHLDYEFLEEKFRTRLSLYFPWHGMQYFTHSKCTAKTFSVESLTLLLTSVINIPSFPGLSPSSF